MPAAEKYLESRSQPKGEEVEVFGKTFSYSWSGSGEIYGNPEIKCDSVKTTIETVSSRPQIVAVKNTEVHCSDRTFKPVDRVLTIDLENQATMENGMEVGRAPRFISRNEGRWFTFKIDLPEMGTGSVYMSLLAFPAGTFTNEPGPAMFFDISLDASGSRRAFSSLLKQEQRNLVSQ